MFGRASTARKAVTSSCKVRWSLPEWHWHIQVANKQARPYLPNLKITGCKLRLRRHTRRRECTAHFSALPLTQRPQSKTSQGINHARVPKACAPTMQSSKVLWSWHTEATFLHIPRKDPYLNCPFCQIYRETPSESKPFLSFWNPLLRGERQR